MIDFHLQRCTRRCAALDRELEAGETYFSVLIEEGSDVIRKDYSAEAWEGPPENSLSWWKATMADTSGAKVQWAPNEVLLHYFEQLEERPDKQDTRYVLALLLVRRRLLNLEETQTEGDCDIFVLTSAAQDREHHVLVVDPSRKRVEEIEQELGKLLFTDGE